MGGIPILPTVVAIMVLGIALLIASATVPLLIPPIAWSLAVLVSAIGWIVERAAALPWAQIAIARFDGWFIAGMYVIGFFAVLRWYHRHDIPMLSPFAFTRQRPHDAQRSNLPVTAGQ